MDDDTDYEEENQRKSKKVKKDKTPRQKVTIKPRTSVTGTQKCHLILQQFLTFCHHGMSSSLEPAIFFFQGASKRKITLAFRGYSFPLKPTFYKPLHENS